MIHKKRLLARNCWIFDLDGTLTVPVHDFPAIRTTLGMTGNDTDILSFIASLPAAEAAEKRAQLMEIEYGLAAKTAASPGAGAFLDLLVLRGSHLGILTRNCREIALHTLEMTGLGRYFSPEAVLGRDEALPKPHPEGIERLLNFWGKTPDDAVMVGDYIFDLQVGRAAGTATIHLDQSRLFRWPELADISVANLGELAAVVTESVN